MKTLDENNGIITDVDPTFTMEKGMPIVEALKKRGMPLRPDLERSMLIEYAGIVKLAAQGTFKKGESILMLGCGRGRDGSQHLLSPDALINPRTTPPVKLYEQLQALL